MYQTDAKKQTEHACFSSVLRYVIQDAGGFIYYA